MGKTLNIYEAKTQLSALVERAAAGEEIVIAKAGQPRARLVPLAESRPSARRRPAGTLRIRHMAADFDAPLPADIQAAFEGREESRDEEPV
ncbi:type II toxin-antitoxin system Phd/YefM family antitoxin [Oceanibaculum pacificum]|uniref:Antitoxin n=1 Tax=Oceanibaculum pacificum TaxID=580166 RepID=A0A154VDZ9_9PROT|nr:type II toxin-antitoxin system prevent-host-death family antitoxin [Oceanibaculum pacificum]KZC99608.1 antitoxin [Oceanibaculum pacificum]